MLMKPNFRHWKDILLSENIYIAYFKSYFLKSGGSSCGLWSFLIHHQAQSDSTTVWPLDGASRPHLRASLKDAVMQTCHLHWSFYSENSLKQSKSVGI